MDSTFAEPDGYASQPLPVRYRIRRYIGPTLDPGYRYALRGRDDPPYEMGDVEVHETRATPLMGAANTRWFRAFAVSDQLFSDQIVRLVQRACAYFYEPDATYVPLETVPGVAVTDDAVKARITRLNRGENAREARRTGMAAYDLEALPWDQQRALIEQIERLKADWGFEVLGEGDATSAPPPEPPPDLSYYDLGY